MKKEQDILVDNVHSSRAMTELLYRKKHTVEESAKDIWIISDYDESYPIISKSSSIIKELLSGKGYNVRELKTTSAPIEQINDTEKKPDLIILDEAVGDFQKILQEAKTARIPIVVFLDKGERKNFADTMAVTAINTPISNNKAFLRFIEKKLNKDQSVANYR